MMRWICRCGGAGRVIGFFLLIVLPFSAQAGDFAISPVHVHLSQHHPIAALVLTNLQDTSLTVQATAQAWSQAHGKNMTTDTHSLIISPPLFAVPPHGKQIIRVGLRTPIPLRQEKDYRLILHEVPPPPNPKVTGVQIVLRMILPVFVAPLEKAAPLQLQVSAHVTKNGFSLQMVNDGNRHVEISGVRISENDHEIFRKDLLMYVLPASRQEIDIPVAQSLSYVGKTLSVQIMTRQKEQPIDASVVVVAS
ncbi:molecular chaperone [Acidithiobacillus sp. M4-SHS-6]|uniref:fimbrial biogenesis chaperone n=1 Tax=Acidithiobacillus sp. M4-SHS-6 TaxID=3383024 RepID=UPI0039BDB2EA